MASGPETLFVRLSRTVGTQEPIEVEWLCEHRGAFASEIPTACRGGIVAGCSTEMDTNIVSPSPKGRRHPQFLQRLKTLVSLEVSYDNLEPKGKSVIELHKESSGLYGSAGVGTRYRTYHAGGV